MYRRYMPTLVLAAVLLGLLGLAVRFMLSAWTATDARMSGHGWTALVLGVVFSLLVGCGLMALMFFSSRRTSRRTAALRPLGEVAAPTGSGAIAVRLFRQTIAEGDCRSRSGVLRGRATDPTMSTGLENSVIGADMRTPLAVVIVAAGILALASSADAASGRSALGRQRIITTMTATPKTATTVAGTTMAATTMTGTTITATAIIGSRRKPPAADALEPRTLRVSSQPIRAGHARAGRGRSIRGR